MPGLLHKVLSAHIGLGLGMLAWTGSAAAQSRVVAPDRNMEPREQAERALDEYSECLLRAERKTVERFLRLYPGDPSIPKLRSLATDGCLDDGELRFSSPLLRGGLFRAMYKEQFTRIDHERVAAAPVVEYSSQFTGAPTDRARQHLALLSFADCVVRKAPVSASAYVLNLVGTAAEKEALNGLGPHLGPCLPAGLQLRFSRPVLRSQLAEALYRIAQASVAATGTAVTGGF